MREYAEHFEGTSFHSGARPWRVPVDLAFPCATQNEVEGADARTLLDNGLLALVEGANMPCTHEAARILRDRRVLYGPGKAANAGGVALSGFEQSQNAQRLSWSRETLDQRLRTVMADIHGRCVTWGEEGDGHIDYVRGANVAGFQKVSEALLAYGIV